MNHVSAACTRGKTARFAPLRNVNQLSQRREGGTPRGGPVRNRATASSSSRKFTRAVAFPLGTEQRFGTLPRRLTMRTLLFGMVTAVGLTLGLAPEQASAFWTNHTAYRWDPVCG